MSIALHSGPSKDEEIKGHRRPHPDLVHLCYELQGGPAVPMTMPVTQRIAAVWRAPGSFEDRLLATIRAAQEAGPFMWEQIIHAREEQDRYDEEMFKLYIRELEEKAEAATSEGMKALRRKFISEEIRAFRCRFIESCKPLESTCP